MKINVLFFGVLKDVAGRPADTIELPESAAVRQLLFHYSQQFTQFEPMASSLAVAVNQAYAGLDHVLRDGDEVGLLPPVSGGSIDGEAIKIVRDPIDAARVIAGLKKPEDGAIAIFDGIVRDNTRGRRVLYLEYECYEGMALQQMKALATEAGRQFAVSGIAMVHRQGRLEIGETSILIAVAAAHRGPAFDACRWLIDTLKKTVPIWKKEYFEDGAVWADGESFPEEIRSSGKQIER